MGQPRILAVLGLGLLGGSVAAALKERRAPWRVTAWDPRRGALEHALREGLIDRAADSAAEAAKGADLVVLAAPVGAIRELLRGLGPHLGPGQVVTDVGSAKASVVAEAEAALPPGVAFVGGHPMAGTERSGVEAADAGLFAGRRCLLTPTRATPPEAVALVSDFWRALGAEVEHLGPEEHDALLARLSHLPNLAAYALVNAVAAAVPPEAWRLGGGALRDVTRVAASPVELWRDVCLENRDAVGRALGELVAQLERLRAAVAAGDGEAAEEFLRNAGRARELAWKP